MIRPINRDAVFLSQKALPASQEDLPLGQDLLDTLQAHRDSCLGLAANMIGVKKRIIVVSLGFVDLLMFNPVLLSRAEPYETEEGCLSLAGSRGTQRYRKIQVSYRDSHWRKKTVTLTDLSAQICQHELDHLEGILI